MRIFKIVIITYILTIITISLSLYLYNKTIWYDKTDCMIQYVNNYYPEWSVYNIPEAHIDKRWLDYLWEEYKINWCYINNTIMSFIINTPYCYTALFFENLIK